MSAESCSILIFTPLEFVVVQLFSLSFDFWFFLSFFLAPFFPIAANIFIRRESFARTFFKGRKHFSSSAKVGREHFSKAATFLIKGKGWARTFFKRPQTFLIKRKDWARTFFQRPQTFLIKCKDWARTFFQKPQTFLTKRKGWARTFFKGLEHFSSDAEVWRKHFQSPPISRFKANNFMKRLRFHLFQAWLDFLQQSMQGAKQSSKSKSKSKKAGCVPLELSKMPLYKGCKKLIISSSSPHHHHFILSIPPFPPNKKFPHPPLSHGWAWQCKRAQKRMQLFCEAIAIGRGGVSVSFPAFFLPIATTSNKNF